MVHRDTTFSKSSEIERSCVSLHQDEYSCEENNNYTTNEDSFHEKKALPVLTVGLSLLA